jgi:hypothetical protein
VTQADAIVKALRALDTANDNHWTADGQPRLDTVKMLAADQSITRDAVTLALPGFTRSKAKDFAGEPGVVQVAPPPPPAEPTAAPAPAEAAAPVAVPLAPVSPAVAAPQQAALTLADTIADLEDDLLDAKATTAELRAARDKASQLFEAARKEEDRLVTELEKLTAKDSNPNAIQAYLETQRLLLQDRGNRRRMVAEAGVNLRELSKAISASPIDQAMARRTGRGGSRPRFPKA